MVIGARLILILFVVILGSVAAEDLFKFLSSILPLLIMVTVVFFIAMAWLRRF